MSLNVAPYVDRTDSAEPDVQHAVISRLRKLNAKNLRDLPSALVLHSNKLPLAVLMRYEHFLDLQTKLQALLNTMEMIITKEEFAALSHQLDDIQQVARTKALSKISAFYSEKE
jgi:hypothetical protein